MYQQSNVVPMLGSLHYLGPAIVLKNENSKTSCVTVEWSNGHAPIVATANIAITRDKPITRNTTVLVAGNSVNEMYVIGLLNVPSIADKAEKQIVQTTQGAFARVNKTKATETLSVYSNKKELLFEYDAINNITKVNVEQGDIELNSNTGNITLNAGKTVEINADTLNMNSKKLSIKAIISDMILGRLETTTDTLIENAKNVYRNVKELTQLRTGRSRTLVDETYQLNADKVLLKSENDVKVKAEKIHLG